MLEAIKTLCDGKFISETWVVNFEKGFHSALLECFPGVDIIGCYFNFAQCTWRRACAEPVFLKRHLHTPDGMKILNQVRSFMALAFVPLNQLDHAFRDLVNPDNLHPVLKPLALYFTVILTIFTTYTQNTANIYISSTSLLQIERCTYHC